MQQYITTIQRSDNTSTLSRNIVQTTNDFDSIREAIIEKGVEVPVGTATSEYAEKIKEISGQEPPPLVL